VTAEKRLELIVRTVNLLRAEMEKHGNRYDGRMIPNLTTITDLVTIDAEYLDDAENSITVLEAQRGVKR